MKICPIILNLQRMKFILLRIACLALLMVFVSTCFSQYNWKLSKDKDGIRIYQSEVKGSNFKSLKVECTLQGTYDKLIAILNNIAAHKTWVYGTKNSYILHRVSPMEVYYYTETTIPWPMSNRDAVVHLKMVKDSLNRFLKINSVGKPKFIAEKSGKVRVPRSNISWYVTMPTAKSLQIVYIFEADPGGNLPAWLANTFAEKGPYESFKKLGMLLKK